MAGYFSDLWATYYDPFYWYVFMGIVVIAVASMAAWFFSVLRPVAGAVFFAVVAFLAGLRKGQHVERDRQAARERNRERRWW